MFASVAASICAMGAQAESSKRANGEKKKKSSHDDRENMKMDAGLKKELLDTLDERIEEVRMRREAEGDKSQALRDIENNFHEMADMIKGIEEK